MVRIHHEANWGKRCWREAVGSRKERGRSDHCWLEWISFWQSDSLSLAVLEPGHSLCDLYVRGWDGGRTAEHKVVRWVLVGGRDISLALTLRHCWYLGSKGFCWRTAPRTALKGVVVNWKMVHNRSIGVPGMLIPIKSVHRFNLRVFFPLILCYLRLFKRVTVVSQIWL